MFDVSIFSALLGGFVTFLAPCTLPLIPAYVGFLGGTGVDSLSGTAVRRRIVLNACFFVLGFSIIFVLFGLVSGALGKFFILHRILFSQLAGALLILFGLILLDIVPLPQLLSRFFAGKTVPAWLTPGRPFSAFLLGLLFALGWSPCLGPVLGAILTLAVSGGTVLYGGFLLSMYALGLAIPFLVVAILYGSAFTYIGRMARYMPLISRFTGVFLVGIGILLLLGQFGILTVWLQQIFHGQWGKDFVQYM